MSALLNYRQAKASKLLQRPTCCHSVASPRSESSRAPGPHARPVIDSRVVRLQACQWQNGGYKWRQAAMAAGWSAAVLEPLPTAGSLLINLTCF